jgi:putative RecB family exonuclease
MEIFSHSRLSAFEHCRLKFSYKYVQRIRPPEGKESIEAFMGKRVHEALEKIYGDARFGKADAWEDVEKYYSKKWDDEWSEEVEIVKEGLEEKNYRDLGIGFLEKYYARFKPFNQSKTICLERRLLINLDESGDYRVQGFVDRLGLRADGTYEIHDYKTSSRLREQRECDEDRQLSFYQMGVQEAWKDAEKIDLVWHYLAFDKEMHSRRNRKQLEETKRGAIKLIDEILDAKEKENFPPTRGALCDYCEYREICPEWKHVISVQMALANEYGDIPGVDLVEEYAELKKEEAEIAGKIEMARMAVIDFAKKEGITVIAGKNNSLLVRTNAIVRFPSPSSEPIKYKKLEKILKDGGVWQDVSAISTALLASAVEEKKYRGNWRKKSRNFGKSAR